MAGTGSQRILCIPRGADKLPGTRAVPRSHCSALEARTSAAKPERTANLEENAETRRCLVTTTAHSSSLARATLRRHSPKVGAVCLNRACTDLSGGRSARNVPTGKNASHPQLHLRLHLEQPCKQADDHAVEARTTELSQLNQGLFIGLGRSDRAVARHVHVSVGNRNDAAM
jgi:hypothetical protein